MRLLLAITLCLSGCGGGSAEATTTETSGTRPVRVDAPQDQTAATGESAAPRRITPSVPGESGESDDLADPPPVEAPTAQ